MNATQGTRTISRESILDMLPQLADTAQYDRAFTYWLQALLLDAGYDSMVLGRPVFRRRLGGRVPGRGRHPGNGDGPGRNLDHR